MTPQFQKLLAIIKGLNLLNKIFVCTCWAHVCKFFCVHEGGALGDNPEFHSSDFSGTAWFCFLFCFVLYFYWTQNHTICHWPRTRQVGGAKWIVKPRNTFISFLLALRLEYNFCVFSRDQAQSLMLPCQMFYNSAKSTTKTF